MMNLTTTKEAIREWNDHRYQPILISSLFCQGVQFHIDGEQVRRVAEGTPSDITYLHAYPGIHKGRLVFSLMNDVMDTRKEFAKERQGIEGFIETSEVRYMEEIPFEKLIHSPVQYMGRHAGSNPVQEEIPTKEALNRILRWSLTKGTWLPKQMKTKAGLFQAFGIPVSDILPKNRIHAFFSLRPPDKKGYLPKADLILWEESIGFMISGHETIASFEDTVRPVPPFGGNSFEPNNFYLLESSGALTPTQH